MERQGRLRAHGARPSSGDGPAVLHLRPRLPQPGDVRAVLRGLRRVAVQPRRRGARVRRVRGDDGDDRRPAGAAERGRRLEPGRPPDLRPDRAHALRRRRHAAQRRRAELRLDPLRDRPAALRRAADPRTRRPGERRAHPGRGAPDRRHRRERDPQGRSRRCGQRRRRRPAQRSVRPRTGCGWLALHRRPRQQPCTAARTRRRRHDRGRLGPGRLLRRRRPGDAGAPERAVRRRREPGRDAVGARPRRARAPARRHRRRDHHGARQRHALGDGSERAARRRAARRRVRARRRHRQPPGPAAAARRLRADHRRHRRGRVLGRERAGHGGASEPSVGGRGPRGRQHPDRRREQLRRPRGLARGGDRRRRRYRAQPRRQRRQRPGAPRPPELPAGAAPRQRRRVRRAGHRHRPAARGRAADAGAGRRRVRDPVRQRAAAVRVQPHRPARPHARRDDRCDGADVRLRRGWAVDLGHRRQAAQDDDRACQRRAHRHRQPVRAPHGARDERRRLPVQDPGSDGRPGEADLRRGRPDDRSHRSRQRPAHLRLRRGRPPDQRPQRRARRADAHAHAQRRRDHRDPAHRGGPRDAIPVRAPRERRAPGARSRTRAAGRR